MSVSVTQSLIFRAADSTWTRRRVPGQKAGHWGTSLEKIESWGTPSLGLRLSWEPPLGGPGPGAACAGKILAKCQLRHLTQIWIKAFFLCQVELIIYIYS